MARTRIETQCPRSSLGATLESLEVRDLADRGRGVLRDAVEAEARVLAARGVERELDEDDDGHHRPSSPKG